MTKGSVHVENWILSQKNEFSMFEIHVLMPKWSNKNGRFCHVAGTLTSVTFEPSSSSRKVIFCIKTMRK